MQAIETETAGPLRLEIVHDDEGGNPREWDQLGKLAIWHEDASGFDELKLGRGWRYGLEETDLEDEDGDEITGADYFREHYGAVGPVIALAIVDYRSNGLRIEAISEPTREEWLGADGAIFATAETLERTGAPADSIERRLLGEIAELEAYTEGRVYGYRVIDRRGETLESCWGFLECDELGTSRPIEEFGGALAEGRGALECELEEIGKRIAEAVRIGWTR